MREEANRRPKEAIDKERSQKEWRKEDGKKDRRKESKGEKGGKGEY